VFNQSAIRDNIRKDQVMRKRDIVIAPTQDLAVACVLLTRLPLPRLPDSAFDHQIRAVWAFPIIGTLLGGIAAATGLLALSLGLPIPVAAGLILAAQIIMTGAMHEDGLADTADGLWGGLTRARRLEIMKDSATGTYGVLALILSTGLRWTALAALLPVGIMPVIVSAILSRSLLPALMAALPHARSDGLSHRVGTPTWLGAASSILIGAILGWGLFGPVVAVALLCAAAPVLLLAFIAYSRIGGQTGDILGAAQQLGEIGVLLALLSLS
jgi:adenosylcobinamide-GDP ribazoletransferase